MTVSDTRPCPHCGGEIKAAAKLCKHCQQVVIPESKGIRDRVHSICSLPQITPEFINQLSELGTAAVPALLDAADSGSSASGRRLALMALQKLARRSHLADLIGVLRKASVEDKAIILRTIEPLVRAGDNLVVRCLKGLDLEDNLFTQLAFIATLGRTRSHEAESLLKNFLDDRRPEIRNELGKALARLKGHSQPSDSLASVFLQVSDTSVSRAERSRQIWGYLDHRSLRALMETPNRARQICLDLLGSDQSRQRRVALLGLYQFADRTCIGRLAAFIQACAQDDELALSLSALERVIDSRDLPLGGLVAPNAKSTDPLVRATAIRCLGRMGERRARPMLEAHVRRDRDQHVRVAARQALEAVQRPRLPASSESTPILADLHRAIARDLGTIATSIGKQAAREVDVGSLERASERIIRACLTILRLMERDLGISLPALASRSEMKETLRKKLEPVLPAGGRDRFSAHAEVQCLTRRGVVLLPMQLVRSPSIQHAALSRFATAVSAILR